MHQSTSTHFLIFQVHMLVGNGLSLLTTVELAGIFFLNILYLLHTLTWLSYGQHMENGAESNVPKGNEKGVCVCQLLVSPIS